MTIPTVHMNGTSKDDLIEENIKAREAVYDAILALQKAGPHGRDFYPQDHHAHFSAWREHNERLGKLRGVYYELTELIDAIDRQGK